MRQHGIEGKLRSRKRRTTIPDEASVERARDLLQRDFTAQAPNEKWKAFLKLRTKCARDECASWASAGTSSGSAKSRSMRSFARRR
jgi:transposase InsO family protein